MNTNEAEIQQMIIDAYNNGRTPKAIACKDASDCFRMTCFSSIISKSDGKYYWNPCGEDLLIKCDPTLKERISLVEIGRAHV